MMIVQQCHSEYVGMTLLWYLVNILEGLRSSHSDFSYDFFGGKYALLKFQLPLSLNFNKIQPLANPRGGHFRKCRKLDERKK